MKRKRQKKKQGEEQLKNELKNNNPQQIIVRVHKVLAK